MNSLEIRQSFFDFFKSKSHEIVASASLMPSSPNLLFTNAGMNQFVPYFLGDIPAPYKRAADTQKCIRAGGKHNDLEDVGFDTYHHTFFEMLGNWSFGDYFKREAIEWAWELLTKVWGFPKERLYATVYMPGAGDPSEFDKEAYDIWAEIFKAEGIDPAIHIRMGNKKDNFWMMGETGPCGPCSELHVDLTPNGDTKGELVNSDSAQCIEIWNLVFMQFNAEENGSFVPLKFKHIDTGMGLERVAGIIATTKNFTDFSALSSNYNSDLFTDIFKKISDMSGKTYGGTIPADRNDMSGEELTDCIFRVLADHIRTLSFSIADGILPGSEGRNYVLRRILRRAVMYGKRLGLSHGFFAKLADALIEKMSPIFPELKLQREVIVRVLANEEKTFERTLDRGLQLLDTITENENKISGEQAFALYDTYGFPIDLTQLIARERGLDVDVESFEAEMEKQRARARAAQKKEVISVADINEDIEATQFLGYEKQYWQNFETNLLGIVKGEDGADFLIFPQTPFYAEKGGQVGDTGTVAVGGKTIEILDTKVNANGLYLHKVKQASVDESLVGKEAVLNLYTARRNAVERHHTATHLLHWALRKVLGTHVRQAGSLVNEKHLRFDFAHFEAITENQLHEIERLANARILENKKLSWTEMPYNEVPESCIAFFGDKYGAVVRVVDMEDVHAELCGGTHVEALGEIGALKIVSEGGIAAGTRRIEAVAGMSAYDYMENFRREVREISKDLSAKPENIKAAVDKLSSENKALEREVKNLKKANAGKQAEELASNIIEAAGFNYIINITPAQDADTLRQLGMETLKLNVPAYPSLIVVLGSSETGNIVSLSSVSAMEHGANSGTYVKSLSGAMEGRGGGKPDFAMGGGKPELLEKAFEEFKNNLK